jgi:hypothetical protein
MHTQKTRGARHPHATPAATQSTYHIGKHRSLIISVRVHFRLQIGERQEDMSNTRTQSLQPHNTFYAGCWLVCWCFGKALWCVYWLRAALA